MKCAVCGKTYIATRTGSHYCSSKCRARASNIRSAKDGTESKKVYVPTGRSVGRPKKDPAPASVPVHKDDLKKYEEFKSLVRKSIYPPPEVIPADRGNYGPGKEGKNTWGQTWDQHEAQKKRDKEKATRWLDNLLAGG